MSMFALLLKTLKLKQFVKIFNPGIIFLLGLLFVTSNQNQPSVLNNEFGNKFCVDHFVLVELTAIPEFSFILEEDMEDFDKDILIPFNNTFLNQNQALSTSYFQFIDRIKIPKSISVLQTDLPPPSFS